MSTTQLSGVPSRTASLKQKGGSERIHRMLEVCTFRGDARELSEFVVRVWRQTYSEKMPLPLWNEKFFEWQLTWREPADRPYCLAVYDGGRLVGTLLGEELRFRWFEQDQLGSMGSWLSVDPDYRRKGVGKLLRQELLNRHRQRAAQFQIGYGYHGSRLSMGPKFWKTFPKDTIVPRSLGFWVRVLNPKAVADWELSRLEGWGARMLGWCQPAPARWSTDPRVRNYDGRDFPPCLELAHGLLDHVDAGIIWEPERLKHQLDHRGFPRTLVFESDGEIGGFVNYHVLDYLGRGTIRVALIDLLAVGEMSAGEVRTLLRTALVEMSNSGVDLALTLRTPCHPVGPLLATGFIPRLADQAILLTRMSEEFDPGRARRFHLYWR